MSEQWYIDILFAFEFQNIIYICRIADLYDRTHHCATLSNNNIQLIMSSFERHFDMYIPPVFLELVYMDIFHTTVNMTIKMNIILFLIKRLFNKQSIKILTTQRSTITSIMSTWRSIICKRGSTLYLKTAKENWNIKKQIIINKKNCSIHVPTIECCSLTHWVQS